MILEAILTAIPATIAAGAAWRNSYKTKVQTTPSNGTSLAAYVEGTHKLLVAHLTDPTLHRQ